MKKNDFPTSNRLPIFSTKPVLKQNKGFVELITKFVLLIGLSVSAGFILGRKSPAPRCPNVTLCSMQGEAAESVIQDVRRAATETSNRLEYLKTTVISTNQRAHITVGLLTTINTELSTLPIQMQTIEQEMQTISQRIVSNQQKCEETINESEAVVRVYGEKAEKIVQRAETAMKGIENAKNRVTRTTTKQIKEIVKKITEATREIEEANQKTKRLRKKYLLLNKRLVVCRNPIRHRKICHCRKSSFYRRLKIKFRKEVP